MIRFLKRYVLFSRHKHHFRSVQITLASANSSSIALYMIIVSCTQCYLTKTVFSYFRFASTSCSSKFTYPSRSNLRSNFEFLACWLTVWYFLQYNQRCSEFNAATASWFSCSSGSLCNSIMSSRRAYTAIENKLATETFDQVVLTLMLLLLKNIFQTALGQA